MNISKHVPFTRLYITAKEQRSFQEKSSKHERITETLQSCEKPAIFNKISKHEPFTRFI